MTHRRPGQIPIELLERIRPLQDAGKFDGVLCKFSFRNGSRSGPSRLLARRCRGCVCGRSSATSWSVVPTSVPPGLSLGFCLRMSRGSRPHAAGGHHRRRVIRFTDETPPPGGKVARARLGLSAPELSEWLDRLRQLAAETDRTYVFFNNC
jgi:hypothetical protein